MLSILEIRTLYVNVTNLDYIQVRKLEHDKEDVLENYERYGSLISYMLSDTLLELRIINTVQNRWMRAFPGAYNYFKR